MSFPPRMMVPGPGSIPYPPAAYFGRPPQQQQSFYSHHLQQRPRFQPRGDFQNKRARPHHSNGGYQSVWRPRCAWLRSLIRSGPSFTSRSIILLPKGEREASSSGRCSRIPGLTSSHSSRAVKLNKPGFVNLFVEDEEHQRPRSLFPASSCIFLRLL